jgi:hypothetical protein
MVYDFTGQRPAARRNGTARRDVLSDRPLATLRQVFNAGVWVGGGQSENWHKLVQGLELLQLHQDREFLGLRNCDGNFSAMTRG